MLFTPQRNQLFRLVDEADISPNIFREKLDEDRYTLEVENTLWRFEISHYSNGTVYPFSLSFLPGLKTPLKNTFYKETTWNSITASFNQWLVILKGELFEPNLWAEATKTAQLFTGTTEAPDDKFTRHELAEVQGQLRQLQQSFAAAALPEPARQKLIELTQTAAVKAESLTKKDWQNWIIGGFISSITALALNPTQASEVLKLVKAVFGGLFLH